MRIHSSAVNNSSRVLRSCCEIAGVSTTSSPAHAFPRPELNGPLPGAGDNKPPRLLSAKPPVGPGCALAPEAAPAVGPPVIALPCLVFLPFVLLGMFGMGRDAMAAAACAPVSMACCCCTGGFVGMFQGCGIRAFKRGLMREGVDWVLGCSCGACCAMPFATCACKSSIPVFA